MVGGDGFEESGLGCMSSTYSSHAPPLGGPGRQGQGQGLGWVQGY